MTPAAPPPAVAAPLVDHPKTYLASVVGVPLKPGDRITGFAFATWGVTFNAVCRIPAGWTIKAGGSLTPEGALEGQASLGSSWLSSGSSPALTALVLVTLYGPIQERDIGSPQGDQYVPATFKGRASIWNDDAERKVRLTSANIRLRPASRCPTS
jgi:hypothetical protein